MLNTSLVYRFTLNDLRTLYKLETGYARKDVVNLVLDRKELNNLLDSAKIYNYVTNQKKLKISSEAFYYIIVRHALLQHEIYDHKIADYISLLIQRFGERSRYKRPATYYDREFEYLFEIYESIQNSLNEEKFTNSVYLGDYSLWTAGLFPERTKRKSVTLEYYDEMGKKGYRLASVHPIAKKMDMLDTFEKMVDIYTEIRISMNGLRNNFHFSS